MKKRLFRICLLMLVLACSVTYLSAEQPDTIRIMPIGDSLTQANDPGYRGYLYRLLKQSGIQFDFVGSKHDTVGEAEYDTDHSGFAGYTIGPGASLRDNDDPCHQGNILFHLDEGYKLLSSKPDVILLMIGINDFFNNRDTMRYNPEVAGAEHLDNLIYHISRILPECTILVSNITPLRGSEHFAELYNSQVEGIVSKYREQSFPYYFVDMRSGIDWNLEKDLGPDNLHPAASGYEKIAERFFKILNTLYLAGELNCKKNNNNEGI